MKTAPDTARPARQADPRIVRKTRRDNAAYAWVDGLPGERNQEYMHPLVHALQTPRLLEFKRPGL